MSLPLPSAAYYPFFSITEEPLASTTILELQEHKWKKKTGMKACAVLQCLIMKLQIFYLV